MPDQPKSLTPLADLILLSTIRQHVPTNVVPLLPPPRARRGWRGERCFNPLCTTLGADRFHLGNKQWYCGPCAVHVNSQPYVRTAITGLYGFSHPCIHADVFDAYFIEQRVTGDADTILWSDKIDT